MQRWLLGVATGKSRVGLLKTLEGHGLQGRFVTLQTSDLAPGKPNPDLLLRAMDEAGVERNATVMIGDTTYDMEMAVNARTRAVGVAWGYHAPEELLATGAKGVAETFSQLPEMVATIMGDAL